MSTRYPRALLGHTGSGGDPHVPTISTALSRARPERSSQPCPADPSSGTSTAAIARSRIDVRRHPNRSESEVDMDAEYARTPSDLVYPPHVPFSWTRRWARERTARTE
jgi:hypothetical protein